SKRTLIAICTGAAMAALWSATACAGPAEFARYQETMLNQGALTLPVAANIEYERGLAAIADGKLEAATEHLQAALALRPQYPDAHFTLARVYARQFNPDAVYHFVQGFVVTATAFASQRALAVNGVVILVLVLLFASGIVWISLAVRYFPFLAHTLEEALRARFNASAARVAAYLLLLAPFALLPGYATGAAIIMLVTWSFMHRRERALSFIAMAMFALLAWFTPTLDHYTTVADPNSLVSLIERANDSPADESLQRALTATSADGLEAERQTALGMLATRAGETENAAAYFLRAISIRPGTVIAYVNLGNVYYLNGQYDKALEGYRKAEQADTSDAVAQYNLAQAYIKTLLMSESSRALARASQNGVDRVVEAIALPARTRMQIYPRAYTNRELWRMAGIEGRQRNPGVLASAISSVTGQSARVGFWIAALALLLVPVVQQSVKKGRLAFQCANCGELTCEGCCNDDRGSVICHACSQVVGGVTSDRVIEALLRQRRQSVVVRRRRSIRWMTMWLPGLRHVFFGRLVSGFLIAALFSLSALMLWTRGYPLPQWDALPAPTPLWKWILPAAGIGLAYWIAIVSRQRYEVRNTRAGSSRQRAGDVNNDSASQMA
ncbi:MAG TPA: tetratricopeptide repeat protein, partial [Candidatus Krumholzibacteria bacterium]|nr:tetratricopeptide repeat protein [Candidatus Krumholzibacteria bacterium]